MNSNNENGYLKEQLAQVEAELKTLRYEYALLRDMYDHDVPNMTSQRDAWMKRYYDLKRETDQ